jgi:hypothetical protein
MSNRPHLLPARGRVAERAAVLAQRITTYLRRLW